MNVSRLRLITFDVTDTLLKFRSSPGKQYGEIGAMYGVLCDNNALSVSFKANWRKMNKEHPNFGLNSGLDWESWWKMTVSGTFKEANINLDAQKLDSIASHLITLYETSMCWQQAYGALGLLSYLRNKKMPLGIVSNFDPRLERTLTNTKLRHYFRFVLTSYETGVEKPHKDIFNKAIEASGVENLKADECLHIGNTASLDYAGAKNSGWNAILINDRDSQVITEKYPYVDSNHLFSNLYDLHKYFINNNRKLAVNFV